MLLHIFLLHIVFSQTVHTRPSSRLKCIQQNKFLLMQIDESHTHKHIYKWKGKRAQKAKKGSEKTKIKLFASKKKIHFFCLSELSLSASFKFRAFHSEKPVSEFSFSELLYRTYCIYWVLHNHSKIISTICFSKHSCLKAWDQERNAMTFCGKWNIFIGVDVFAREIAKNVCGGCGWMYVCVCMWEIEGILAWKMPDFRFRCIGHARFFEFHVFGANQMTSDNTNKNTAK